LPRWLTIPPISKINAIHSSARKASTTTEIRLNNANVLIHAERSGSIYFDLFKLTFNDAVIKAAFGHNAQKIPKNASGDTLILESRAIMKPYLEGSTVFVVGNR
jgi:hypothetical protein